MAEYYIRTPDRDESRGPFTPAQLLTLAEAEQVTINTLYYDDFKEEWLPLGTNPELKDEVFPEREKLKLKIDEPEEPEKKPKKKKKSKAKEKAKNTVTEMLAVAEKETKNVRSKRKQEESFTRATYLTSNGLCLIMLLSAVTLITPHLTEIKEVSLSQQIRLFLNYPLIILGAFDLLMSVYAYFGDRKLNSILRGRAMLTLGFGAYIGWATGDLYILLASISFGLGT
ncbi:MAG: cation transport ATPase, partial [Lentimonas sp.]